MEKILSCLRVFIPKQVFLFCQPVYHFSLSFSAALFYGFPSRGLFVIGVTGTKGKTTVIELVHNILEEAGASVASASSLRFRLGGREEKNEMKMTTPGRFFIQRFLHRARRGGCRYAVLEITSEGIRQFRHRFIKFDVALMTNVAPEHIEAHGSIEKYLRAKLDLFWRLKPAAAAIINQDDPQFQRFSAATAARKVFYGKEEVEAGDKRYAIRHLEIGECGISFELGGTTFSSPLLGEFNFYNILAAAAVGLSQHVSLEKIAAAVSRLAQIPGRMEFVQKEPFAVVVDYAHTPDSLKKVCLFLRESSSKLQAPSSKLICVLGSAGGGRDKWKRPELGKIAAEFCDQVILTNEDPYDESPHDIINQIESGFSQASNVKCQMSKVRKILDRREAIRGALKSAKPGDVTVITGKGAELWMMGPNSTKIPWDDRKIVREELEKLKNEAR